jgi:beta-lactam-binding protein with PASTA domain
MIEKSSRGNIRIMSTHDEWPPVQETVVTNDAQTIVDTPETTVVATDAQTIVDTPETTVVASAPPPPVVPPRGIGPGDRIGMGMLLGIVLLAAAGAILAAVLLTRNNDKGSGASATTVVVTTQPSTVTVATQKPASAAVTVPSLVGQTQATAAAALKNEGFKIQLVTVPGPPPAGRITAQSPAPGESLAPGSMVRLNVSNGLAGATPSTSAATTAPSAASTTAAVTPAAPPVPATAHVPELSGDVQAAAAALSRAGFLASIAYIPGSDPLGTVEHQAPAAGTSAPTGSHVTVNVSSGPGQKIQETVPDATGQTLQQAVATMQHAGLRLIFLKRTVTDRAQAGKIIEQTPPAGKTAPKNAQVLVYLGAFKG